MLTNVHLKNLALIKEADIDLTDGLNILTGETGAGKSIFFGSVNIALGSKASKSMIRSGCNYAVIELVFESDDENVFNALKSLDIEPDEKRIIISRKITEGSGISKINGETVTLSGLRTVTSLLVDFHGQNDHQSLLDSSRHLDIVDDFGGSDVASVKLSLKHEHENYVKLRRLLKGFNLDEESLKRETALLKSEFNEIEAAALKEKEDKNLEYQYEKFSHAENVNNLLLGAAHLLDSDTGALGKISKAVKEINTAQSVNPDLKPINDAALDIESLTADLLRELSSYTEKNKFDAARYAQIKERLDEINRLKARYGHTLEDIFNYAESVKKKLEEYEGYYENKSQLETLISGSASKLNTMAKELSSLRKKTAERLAPAITAHLKDLNFLDVNFEIRFDKNKTITENGFDKVEFLISVNPGEPLMPLSKVASGGEMSRVMLAIKSAIAEHENISTLIFDEIDTGISGRTAQKVSEKLKLLSRNHQLICITHLPQIAAMADTHFLIDKDVSDGETITHIRRLNYDDSVLELARLLGGRSITDAVLNNAAEMKLQSGKIS